MKVSMKMLKQKNNFPGVSVAHWQNPGFWFQGTIVQLQVRDENLIAIWEVVNLWQRMFFFFFGGGAFSKNSP